MFFQPPDDEHNNAKLLPNNPRRRRKKIFWRKNKSKGAKKFKQDKGDSRFAITMSAWAENFTKAATWQLKHQIAYWKSKAMALEYENRILHDIIRKNYVNASQCEPNAKSDSEHEEVEEIDEEHSNYDDKEDENEEFEVSEEFIQFLKENAKYKEEARKERERLKKMDDSDSKLIEEMEAGPSQPQEDKRVTLEALYGEKWQCISALETSLQSQFINMCDSGKPMHWPNIPFNFNFS